MLYSELKRRKVFQVAVAYLVAGWVIAQAADLVLDNVGAPPWVMQILIFAISIGFILAVIFTWAYEVTPEGIKRESDVHGVDESFRQAQSKRLNIVTFALLAVAIALILVDRRWTQTDGADNSRQRNIATSDSRTSSATPSDFGTSTTDQSIAVLPFIALTTDENDSFFGKGLAEELLNALAKFPTLKVAARTSAFSLAAEDVDIREIGSALNVAHVLEGSVRRSGDRIRITAQLIRAQDGFHLWSETFESRFTDIFRIQDEIVEDLSRVLQIRLGVGAGAGRVPDRLVTPEAYELYLRGLDLWWTRSVTGHRAQAIQTFMHVTELDPDFADGWAAFASSLALSSPSFFPRIAPESAMEVISSAFENALAIDPDNTRALAGLVYFHVNRKIDIPAANEYLQRAMTVAPNYGFNHYAAAQFYFSIGDQQRSTDAIKRAIVADPLNRTLARIEFQHEAAFGRYPEKSTILDELESCTTTDCDTGQWLLAWAAMAAALHAADESDLRRMRDIFQRAYMGRGAEEYDSDVYEFLMKYAESILGESDTEYWDNSDFLAMQSIGVLSSDASVLARQGRDDDALTMLEEVAESGRFFASRGVPYVLWPGRFEIPEHIRRDPRYHRIWTLPGMPEIELARRANGVTAGLPLPVQ